MTRFPPRLASKVALRRSAERPSASNNFLTSDSTVASAMRMCSVAAYWSPSSPARVSAVASTRTKGPESCGCVTELPCEEGSLLIAASAPASSRAGSPPADSISAATVLSGGSSSPRSRCAGSALGLPLVSACRMAAVTASRLLVVSFSVFMGTPEDQISKLSLLHSTQFPDGLFPLDLRQGVNAAFGVEWTSPPTERKFHEQRNLHH